MIASELVSRFGAWHERREGLFVHLDCGDVPIVKIVAKHYDEVPAAPSFYREYAESLVQMHRETAASDPFAECAMLQ